MNINNKIIGTFSYLVAVWTSYVFIGSLFFKFTDALEPIHIFNTIGNWMNGFFGATIGGLFASYGAYFVGIFELLASLILLMPIILWKYRQCLHFIGSLMAVFVMVGAIFFHLFTPLGWHPTWVVISELECQGNFIAPNMCSDIGLANAAVSILILNLLVAFLNRKKPFKLDS